MKIQRVVISLTEWKDVPGGMLILFVCVCEYVISFVLALFFEACCDSVRVCDCDLLYCNPSKYI